MSFILATVVEGHGDVSAVRVLVQRMAPDIMIARPVRQPRGKLAKREGLQHAVRIAAANLISRGAVLVLFDADDDCAKEKGPELQSWLNQDFPHLICRVVLAVRAFEAWIVGGDPVYNEDDPDSSRDLEGKIKVVCGTYKKTVDQPRCISQSDLQRLRVNSRSFKKFEKTIAEFQLLTV